MALMLYVSNTAYQKQGQVDNQMSEEVNSGDTVKLDKERKVRVLLDPSPQVVSKDEEIAKLNQELGKKDEIIKAYMISEKNRLIEESKKEEIERAERVNQPLPPPTGGETAPLYEPKEFKVDIEGSEIPPEWVKGSDVADVIDKVELLAKKAGNKDEYQRIQSKMLKNILKNGFSFEFQGSSKDFMKSPIPISEFDSQEVREAKERKNSYLKANRQNWRHIE